VKSYNSFLSLNWTSTYQATDQMWLMESLNWEKTLNQITTDWTLFSFIFQSSFLNQHILVDSLVKLSYLDTVLIKANLYSTTPQFLYLSILNDTYINTVTCFIPFTTLFESDYTELVNSTLLISPELSNIFNDYTNSYFINKKTNLTPVAVFDSYTDISNFYFNEGVIYFMLFSGYIWFIIIFFLTIITLRWVLPVNSYFVRFYYYVYAITLEVRLQFETLFQTLLFFILYWLITLLTFDDEQEEMIEFMDTCFFLFFLNHDILLLL